MTTYFQVLTVLEYLLDKAGEKYWRDWIHQDMDLWQSRKDVSHHLSAYGGMGTFNDIWIIVQNGYNVTKGQEPWINNLFEILKGLCFHLAHSPEKDESIKDVESHRYHHILGAFKNNFSPKEMDDATIQFAAILSQLYGSRCLKCSYSETSSYNIENYLARVCLSEYVSNAKTEAELMALVDSAFNIDFEGLEEERSQLRRSVSNSRIEMVDRESWMRPCPKCGSDDTAAYYWKLSDDVFLPSKA